jgi:hypothetical protein
MVLDSTGQEAWLEWAGLLKLRRPSQSTTVDFSTKRRLNRSSNDARQNNVDSPVCVSL